MKRVALIACLALVAAAPTNAATTTMSKAPTIAHRVAHLEHQVADLKADVAQLEDIARQEHAAARLTARQNTKLRDQVSILWWWFACQNVVQGATQMQLPGGGDHWFTTFTTDPGDEIVVWLQTIDVGCMEAGPPNVGLSFHAPTLRRQVQP